MTGFKILITTLGTVIAGCVGFATLGIESSRSGAQATGKAERPVKTLERTCAPAGPKFFVVGVWMVPPSHMRAWKERGANTLLSVGEGIDPKQHDASARAMALHQIRAPLPTLEKDLSDASVLAFETSDEPSNIVNGAARLTPDQVSAEQELWTKEMARIGACKPIFTNHVGNHIWHANSRIGLGMSEYHTRSDWYGSDTYQIADGKPNLLTQDGFSSTYQGHILHQQRLMAPEAPLLSFVQTAPIMAGGAVPTPGQLKTQIWSSIINDASMIGIFAIQLGPVFSWDATPRSLAVVLRDELAKVKAAEPLLIDGTKGGSRPGRIYRSAPQGQAPKPDQLPWPFEARSIQDGDRTYTIVANLSESPAMLTSPLLSARDVRFDANEVKQGYGDGWASPP